jgi:hypothetical protein
MDIKNAKELASAALPGIVSLDDECRPIEHQRQIVEAVQPRHG